MPATDGDIEYDLDDELETEPTTQEKAMGYALLIVVLLVLAYAVLSAAGAGLDAVTDYWLF